LAPTPTSSSIGGTGTAIASKSSRNDANIMMMANAFEAASGGGGARKQSKPRKGAGGGAPSAPTTVSMHGVLDGGEHEPRHVIEGRKARELLDSAEELLKEVDESPTVGGVVGKKQRRQFPTFDKAEVRIGPLLGVGGFCNVYEVKGFRLIERKEPEVVPPVLDENADGVGNGKRHEAKGQEGGSNDDGGDHIDSLMKHLVLDGVLDERDLTAGHANDELEDEEHYDPGEAREYMQLNARRPRRDGDDDKNDGGDARYAIKRLHTSLTELERTRGMIDLAIESKFLSVLWHPNIIKMRAVASGPTLDRHFFIVMDRLYDTLDKRLKAWAKTYSAARGNIFGRNADKETLNRLMLDRMVVAYDLSTALDYMHEMELVYRDVKLDNIGFDVRGDVKVGCCRSCTNFL